VSVGFDVSVDMPAVQHQTPAPLKLPSDGGNISEWYEKSRGEMATADLQTRLCAGGAAGDASWRGACAEFVRSSSIACTDECRDIRGGHDLFGDSPDESFDTCAARDERTCYNVCFDDKLFNGRDVVLGNGTAANPPCINRTADSMHSVRREREDFWNQLLDAATSGARPGDSFWTEDWEWAAQKKGQVKIQAQFDSFWETVCKNDASAACEGVPGAAKKTFLLRRKSSQSRTSRQLIRYLRSQRSLTAYKGWLEESQFPGVMALSAICQSRSTRHVALHSNMVRNNDTHLLEAHPLPAPSSS